MFQFRSLFLRRHRRGADHRTGRRNLEGRQTLRQRARLRGITQHRAGHTEQRAAGVEVRHVTRHESVEQAALHARGQHRVEQRALHGVHPESARGPAHRHHRGARLAAFGERPRDGALRMVAPRPERQTAREVAGVEPLARLALPVGERRATCSRELGEQLFPAFRGEQRAEHMAVAAVAEALLAVGVRRARTLEHHERLAHARGRQRIGAANPYGETVAAQLARTQLRVVAARPQHLDRRVLEHRRIGKARQVHRHRLARDGLTVLHARVPDRRLSNAAVPGEHPHQFVVRHAALLHAEVQMLPLPARLDQRDLVDEEVLGPFLDHAGEARMRPAAPVEQRVGEPGQRHGIRFQSRRASSICGTVSRDGSTRRTRHPAASAARQLSGRSSK